MTTLAIAHPQQLLLDAVDGFIRTRDDLKVVFKTNSSQKLITRLGSAAPDVLIINLELSVSRKNKWNVDLLKSLRETYPSLKIIVCSDAEGERATYDLFECGVFGHLNRAEGIAKLATAIKRVAQSHFYPECDLQQVVAFYRTRDRQAEKVVPFSKKEIQVMELYSHQLSNKEIAEQMGLSVKSIEKYKANMIHRTDSLKIIGVLEYMYKHGLLERT
jgi:DNA-binding NarL/FixJ family response regulator